MYLVFLNGVRYLLDLLNEKFRRITIYFTYLSNQVSFVFASFFFLTYRRLFLNLTAPDNALGSLSISLYDTHLEEMTMCPGLLKTNGLRSCYYHKDISGIMICNIGFDDTKLKIA